MSASSMWAKNDLVFGHGIELVGPKHSQVNKNSAHSDVEIDNLTFDVNWHKFRMSFLCQKFDRMVEYIWGKNFLVYGRRGNGNLTHFLPTF